jgi:cytochrome c oxidase cbb3-type subunit 3
MRPGKFNLLLAAPKFAFRAELRQSIAQGMNRPFWILSVALIGVAVLIAQAPGDQPGRAKGAPRNPAQSPASQPRPQTAKSQAYSIEQIQAGELRFRSQCGFCHGRDAAGGETGPDLTRSGLVADDLRGDKIGAVVRKGVPDKGMPSFDLSDTDMGAIVAFIHDQKTKFDALGGGRRSVDAADLATGDAAAGGRYFNGAGACSGCHSASGDLAGIASRYQGLKLLQRMLYPSGQPAPARPKVTLTLASGQTIIATLASEDEFSITVLDSSGARETYEKEGAVKFKIDNPLAAHFDQLGKYTDPDMHNVYAYLETLK